MRGSLIELDDRRFELLYEACRLHTDGLTDGDLTLQVCWDADRLDLGRVGITPVPHLLCTDAAREILEWAGLAGNDRLRARIRRERMVPVGQPARSQCS